MWLITIGNISWGHATSHDMISWTDVDHFPKDSIKAWPGVQAQSIGTTNLTSKHHPPQYNRLGIFSGTAQPVNLTGEMDGTLLAFYTSVSELPFSWNAPYPKGAESQSLAYSTDGGVSWQEYSGNPVLSQPPGGWNITGWRDPFFLPIPKLDALLKYSEPHYYVIFGSGIGGVGPRVPLYAAPASNLTNWNFLGALWEPTGNTSISGNIFETGSYGWQFEVPDFFNLGDYWFISTGTQGGSTTYHPQNWAIWNEGTISARSNGSVEFTPISGGAADWGILYAVSLQADAYYR
jgi:beta-fructofuranosidase